MIARLTGKIVYKSIDHLIVDVGGVGYRLIIPLSTYYALPDQETVSFFVYTSVREDAIHLYGFLDNLEKEFFALLISVSGVGPRLAVNILSNIAAAKLGNAIEEGDIQRLTAIPGIGKKTAERLVLELREKVKRLGLAGYPAGIRKEPFSPTQVLEDAVSALVNLGYKESQAKKALKAIEAAETASVETILKSALKILAQ
ncbi:MAG: Holliday junction branch migration protein RuvA [Deltaproteobacteria bacterium]|nr:Holliday junction branch migration protein RuvA [Deltaproteobacteria bacterium]